MSVMLERINGLEKTLEQALHALAELQAKLNLLEEWAQHEIGHYPPGHIGSSSGGGLVQQAQKVELPTFGDAQALHDAVSKVRLRDE